jgi:anaphase-promoting complex subunit 7
MNEKGTEQCSFSYSGQLNSVPAALRTLTIHLLLGKLYLSEGLKNKAEESYRSALRDNPYALEATLALAEIAATRESTSVATPSSAPGNLGNVAGDGQLSSVTNPAFWQKEIESFCGNLASGGDAVWMQMLVSAHIHTSRGRYRAAMDALDVLDRLFPNNLHCLLQKGKLEMDQEFYHQAHLNFYKARQIDDQNLRLMDAHADCLRKNGARVQLNNLVQDLFDTSEHHVESWLAAAFFCEMKGDYETAAQFCDRAIATDRKYAPAYLFRGTLLLQQLRPEHALLAFTQSCKLAKTLEAYSGMVMSYCELSLKGLNKYKEALTTAKTVVKLYPQKAQSYTLLGHAFALRPETSEQAKKAFLRALVMEPRKLAAVFGLVDLLVQDGNIPQAISRYVWNVWIRVFSGDG